MQNALMTRAEAKQWRENHRTAGRTVVFTNGCYDILHPGHVSLLETCRSFGDALIVAINSDASVRRIKGDKRPIVAEEDRARVLRGLRAVDAVVLFDEDTPAEIIDELVPDVLVKGGDWTPETVVGAETVQRAGGRVEIVPLVQGRSTTSVIDTIRERYCGGTGDAD